MINQGFVNDKLGTCGLQIRDLSENFLENFVTRYRLAGNEIPPHR